VLLLVFAYLFLRKGKIRTRSVKMPAIGGTDRVERIADACMRILSGMMFFDQILTFNNI